VILRPLVFPILSYLRPLSPSTSVGLLSTIPPAGNLVDKTSFSPKRSTESIFEQFLSSTFSPLSTTSFDVRRFFHRRTFRVSVANVVAANGVVDDVFSASLSSDRYLRGILTFCRKLYFSLASSFRT